VHVLTAPRGVSARHGFDACPALPRALPERVFVGLVASPELSATAWTANFEGVSVRVQ
jgi:hypothetical protein